MSPYQSLTAYYDQSLDKCYVIPLNTSIVMPPRDLLELLVNIKVSTAQKLACPSKNHKNSSQM